MQVIVASEWICGKLTCLGSIKDHFLSRGVLSGQRAFFAIPHVVCPGDVFFVVPKISVFCCGFSSP